MTIQIINTDTGHELWTASQCATHCGVTNATWNSYVNKHFAPPISEQLNQRTPLWDAEEVKVWHANRPGSPVRNAPKPKATNEQ